MNTQTQFSQNVLTLIQSIPKGKVATYGLIAMLAGNPRGSRGVGWLLHSCTKSHKLPWQRVIKSNGQLSFPASTKNYFLQENLLASEGIIIIGGRVDLKKYLWHK